MKHDLPIKVEGSIEPAAIDAESMSIREFLARVKIGQVRTLGAMFVGLIIAAFAFGVKFNDATTKLEQQIEAVDVEKLRLLEKKILEVERILNQSELLNDGDVERLRRKLRNVWNSYLVKIEIRDAATGKGLPGAAVEIHEIYVPEEQDLEVLRARPPEEPIVRGLTDMEGRAYFGFSDEVFVLRLRTPLLRCQGPVTCSQIVTYGPVKCNIINVSHKNA